MKLQLICWLTILSFSSAEFSLRVGIPGSDSFVEIAPLATLPIEGRVVQIEPAADGRAVVVATTHKPALHVIRIDEPANLGSIPLNGIPPFAANGNAVFVYDPDTRRITRHPLPELRASASVAIAASSRFVNLSAAVSSTSTPLWASIDSQLHAFDPKTLSPAGIVLYSPGKDPVRLPAEGAPCAFVSPSGEIIGGSSFIARSDQRTLKSATAPSRAALEGCKLASDGLHFVKHGCYRSLAVDMPAEPSRGNGGRVALDGSLWWAPGTGDKLLIRSGSADRVLVELTSEKAEWNQVFISFKHKRLAVAETSGSAIRIYPFDLPQITATLKAPAWIDVRGVMVVPQRRPMSLRILTPGDPGQLKLTSAPEDATLDNGILKWIPPTVPNPAPFRFAVDYGNEATQSFEVLVLPEPW